METIAALPLLRDGGPSPPLGTTRPHKLARAPAASARAHTAGATHTGGRARSWLATDHSRPWRRLQQSHTDHMARKCRSRSAETRDPTTPHLSREAQGKRIVTCRCQRTTSLGPWQARASVPHCWDASRGPHAHGARTPRAANAKQRNKRGARTTGALARRRTHYARRAPPHESCTAQARRRHGHRGRTASHTCHTRHCLPARSIRQHTGKTHQD